MIPIPFDGLTDDLLPKLDPTVHPHELPGDSLRRKWSWIRSRYNLSYINYSSSVQEYLYVFPEYTNGQPLIYYLPCALNLYHFLDILFSNIGEEQKAEAGLGDSNTSDLT